MLIQFRRLTTDADRRKVFRVVKPPPNRLEEIRELRGLTQSQLAERAGEHGRYTSSQQQVHRHESGETPMKDFQVRAYAAVLDCSEQDIMGPPRSDSVFGYTKGPGDLGPPLNEELMARVIDFVEANVPDAATTSSKKKATLVSVIYASAIRDSAERGLPADQLDLDRYRGMLRLVA